ncbi:MAG TPA: FAD-dependent oxidoreductase [Candidatus Paceibacterota bacterium]|nr:FAD-dependent oxidoreductase [Candidatus Paceibacterota bacterium]
MYDLAIVGGGPAGVAAGVYAARKKLKTVFIAEQIGGQSMDSVDIQNWIGTQHISGMGLAKQLEMHLHAYAADVVDMHLGERAQKAQKIDGGFSITTGKGTYDAKALLVATGGMRRKLDISTAAPFENKGLTYCASCDGPLFSGQDAVVVGGGNAAFETAAQLLAYCKSVTLIARSDFAKADAATVDAVLAHPNMKALQYTVPVEVKGEMFVSGLVVKNTQTNEQSELPVAGIFVEIGMLPSTDWVKDLVKLDEYARVVVDARNQRTYGVVTPKNSSDARRGESGEGDVLNGAATETQEPRNAAAGEFFGVWAAGDCTDELYHQNNIAAGDAVKALEDIYYWVKQQKSK